MFLHDVATRDWLGDLERGDAQIPSSGREARSSTSFGAGFVPAAPVLSGTYVTPQTSLCLTAVYAAINRIAGDVATLPVQLYRKTSDGGLRLDTTDYYEELLNVETDDETGSFKFHLDSGGHTLGWGNGYAEIVRDSRGRADEIHILHPSKTIPKREDNGKLLYHLDNKRVLLPENVLHFAGLGFDGIQGYTPLTVARQTIGLGIAAEQFGAGFFGQSAIPKGILKTKKTLKEEAQSNLRRTINQVHQGSQSAHQFMILEEGMDWIQTQISPEDAQFLLTRQFTVIEIARLYGVPPHKIGDYSQAHLANVEESNLDYLSTTLGFWIAMRERVYNRRLLSRNDRRKWVIRHDQSKLKLGSMAARIAYYSGMRNMGCFSADDILRKEGENPLGAEKGGDKYFVQAQYISLDQAGKPLGTPAKPEPKPTESDPQPVKTEP